ncbi:MAG: class D sortase [Pseudomonadota bacterium]
MSCLGCEPAAPLKLALRRERRTARRRVRAATAVILIAAGLITAAGALYHPAKARLGQHLLTTAWEAGGAKPWGWADFTAYARIDAPRLGVSAIALSTATGAAMAWGPGHVTGTAEPGEAGLAAFAGHRDSHFAFLGDLRPGDEVRVETKDGRHAFRISSAIVVDSRKWRLPVGGRERLALSTCWPLGAETPGPLRLIVFADPLG